MISQTLPTPSPELRSGTSDAQPQFSEVTDRIVEQGQQFVRSNPAGILIAALIMAFVAAVLMRRHQPTLRERIIESPLDEMRSLLGRLRADLGSKAEKRVDGSLSAIERALHKAKRALS